MDIYVLSSFPIDASAISAEVTFSSGKDSLLVMF